MTPAGVTVAIATADRPASLARCLEALAAGNQAPLEVVVVDQGSLPETEVVVRARAAALPRLRLVPQARRGLSASRNLGLQETVGAILAVTDDDCVPDPGWVAAIAAALDEDPSLAGVTGPMLPLGADQPGLVAVSSRTSSVRIDHRRGASPWNVGTGGNMAVRREWLARVGGWDERLGVGAAGKAGEDIALVDRLLTAGAVIRYEPAAIVRHERRASKSRRATRWTYGHGVGTSCGILLREGHIRGATTLGRWTSLRLGLAARSLVRADIGEAVDEARVLCGTVLGVVRGVRLGGRS